MKKRSVGCFCAENACDLVDNSFLALKDQSTGTIACSEEEMEQIKQSVIQEATEVLESVAIDHFWEMLRDFDLIERMKSGKIHADAKKISSIAAEFTSRYLGNQILKIN